MEKRFIACSNIFPIKSLYWWKGDIVDDNEVVMLVKSVKDNYEKIIVEVKNVHSYEVPCIVKYDIEANEDYEKWLKEEVKTNP